MALSYKQKRIALFAGIFLLFIAIVVAISFFLQPTNQFGKSIIIKNYPDKVKGVDKATRDTAEATLYKLVQYNGLSEPALGKINDALIRDGSNVQTSNQQQDYFTGNFIVDIESIKQSYYVQYRYSKNETAAAAGDNIVISCLPQDKLKFGAFECKDYASQQSGQNDIVIQYLPFENFSFRLVANTADGEDNIVLLATLYIPEADLKGNPASKQQTVALYKNEVTQWISSKNINPSNYTIFYNYDDAGNQIPLSS